jgi:2C-methyl-D-erythritol 2,4-cyclodiphosphate synthase
VAEALGIAPDQINVKATTNEGADAIGQEEAIAAMAVALIRCETNDGEETEDAKNKTKRP